MQPNTVYIPTTSILANERLVQIGKRYNQTTNETEVLLDRQPKPPPKRYSFAEAYAMMKQGRWMKPVAGTRNGTRVEVDGWVTRDSISTYPLKPAFDVDEIDDQWVEA